jgi:hypothetical protein
VLPDAKQAQDTWTNFAVKYGAATATCAIGHLIGDVFIAGPVDDCTVHHRHRVNHTHYPFLKFARDHILRRHR